MSDQAPPPPPPPPPPAYGTSMQTGQMYVGQVRSTGMAMLLFFVTFGIYGLVWWYLVHDEMKKHSGQGIGGLVALILAVFVSPAAAFFTSDEVGKLHARTGRQAPVSALTGLWYFPGIFLIFLPIIWFVKTNGALNDYWRAQGAAG
jgi:hypothetical protein